MKRDGREPSGFAAVLAGLMTDRAWELPTAGGSVLDRWPDIAAAVAPQLPHHVAAIAFHPETGQLHLRPDSPAIAEAVERQTASMRALSLRAFPEPEQAAGKQPAPIEQSRIERRGQADVSHSAALRRARAAREAGTAATVPQSTPLGRTA
ncbi:hypothetical protein [Streptomyces ramulosus]|uniref:hypothetical protein n=1 Tax=Streptomyces TaxID=1883 RepID=UPI0031E531A8